MRRVTSSSRVPPQSSDAEEEEGTHLPSSITTPEEPPGNYVTT